MFETFSYLPPLTDNQIAAQVDYIVNNGWTPCLEFSESDLAYVNNANVVRFQGVSAVSINRAQSRHLHCVPHTLDQLQPCRYQLWFVLLPFAALSCLNAASLVILGQPALVARRCSACPPP